MAEKNNEQKYDEEIDRKRDHWEKKSVQNCLCLLVHSDHGLYNSHENLNIINDKIKQESKVDVMEITFHSDLHIYKRLLASIQTFRWPEICTGIWHRVMERPIKNPMNSIRKVRYETHNFPQNKILRCDNVSANNANRLPCTRF